MAVALLPTAAREGEDLAADPDVQAPTMTMTATDRSALRRTLT
jgi:hypothetical protein